MRITAIKVEDGSQGRGYPGDVRFDIGSDFASDIGEAVEIEHPCSDQCSCDISAALENGYPLSAAYLLSGATETPVLQAVADAHRFNRTPGYQDLYAPYPADWDAWCDWHKENGIECPDCGTFNFPDDFWTPETCGNCLAALPQPIEDE